MILTASFMTSSSVAPWVTGLILTLWVGKCLSELVLLYVTIARQVRYVWALGFYTFLTTLPLMILVEARWSYYGKADSIVTACGVGMMALVIVGVLTHIAGEAREYEPVLSALALLIGLQLLDAWFEHKWGCLLWVNIYGIAAWICSVLLLAWTCYRLPVPPLGQGLVARIIEDFTGVKSTGRLSLAAQAVERVRASRSRPTSRRA